MSNADEDFKDLDLAESEEAIQAALKFLHYNDPAKANRDYAIYMLKRMDEVSIGIGSKTKLDFEEFLKKHGDDTPS